MLYCVTPNGVHGMSNARIISAEGPKFGERVVVRDWPAGTDTTLCEDMPCTVNIGSDSTPAFVSKVLSPKLIRVTEYDWTGNEWVAENANGEWSLRKDGRWRPVGAKSNSGYSLSLGRASHYRDPSF